MKFQSLEENSGVSIFQEYIIGLNSLVEKNFMKLKYTQTKIDFLYIFKFYAYYEN